MFLFLFLPQHIVDVWKRAYEKPRDVLKVKQTWPVDTDLLEFPNSFQNIQVQLRET